MIIVFYRKYFEFTLNIIVFILQKSLENNDNILN